MNLKKNLQTCKLTKKLQESSQIYKKILNLQKIFIFRAITSNWDRKFTYSAERFSGRNSGKCRWDSIWTLGVGNFPIRLFSSSAISFSLLRSSQSFFSLFFWRSFIWSDKIKGFYNSNSTQCFVCTLKTFESVKNFLS